MLDRRRFFATLTAGLTASQVSFADEARPRRSRWEMIFNDDPIGEARHRPEPETWSNDTITAAWIGHSTILLNFYGVTILTDPVFSERIGLSVAGLFTLGPKRIVAPALTLEQLPPVDLILLSHAHMDHLDLPSLDAFDRTTPLIMAANTTDVVEHLDFTTIYELDWGHWTEVKGVRIEALPTTHFGWRFPWERDRSRGHSDGRSYNAYLLSRNGRYLLFGGDTSYNEQLLSLRERSIAVELAMMPIGAYDPWIRVHANPEQAVTMAEHAGARVILPMHWSTFIQSDEPTGEPIARLRSAAADRRMAVAVETIGQTWTFSEPSTVTPVAQPVATTPAQ